MESADSYPARVASRLFSVQILDEIFFENYKKFREEEQKLMQAELAKMQQAMHMQQGGGLPMPPWEGSGGQVRSCPPKRHSS